MEKSDNDIRKEACLIVFGWKEHSFHEGVNWNDNAPGHGDAFASDADIAEAMRVLIKASPVYLSAAWYATTREWGVKGPIAYMRVWLKLMGDTAKRSTKEV